MLFRVHLEFLVDLVQILLLPPVLVLLTHTLILSKLIFPKLDLGDFCLNIFHLLLSVGHSDLGLRIHFL